MTEFAKLATKIPDVVFLQVDICVNKDAARAHRITHIPAFILFKNKKEVDRMVGVDLALLKQKINNESEPQSAELVDDSSIKADVTSQQELDDKLKANKDKLVVLWVYATWCPPCKGCNVCKTNQIFFSLYLYYTKCDSSQGLMT